jgi:hypothetical protein
MLLTYLLTYLVTYLLIYLLTYLLTYLLLTPRSTFFLEKLTGLKLVKKFSAFCGTQTFITTFTSARHLSLFWTSLNQSTLPYPNSWRPVKITLSDPYMGLPCTLYMNLLHTIWSTCAAYLILLGFISSINFGEQYRSLKSSICSFLHSLLAPKYFSQHPILKKPQLNFLPQCERPRFTPTKYNRQNYIFVYL